MSDVWLNLFVAWGVQASAVASPGPGVLFLLAIATGQGRGHALAACVGIALAAVIWATATVVGLSALLAEVGALLTVVKILGAAYLAWLAWKSFHSAVSPKPVVMRETRVGGFRRAIWSGFVMQMSNPKAIFFWIAIASLGATADAPGWAPAVFIIGAVAISFGLHAVWALGFSTRPVLAVYNRARRWIDATLGCFFAFAAFKLATSRS